MNRFMIVVALSAGALFSACEKKAVSLKIDPPEAKLSKAGMAQTLVATGLDSDGAKAPVNVTWSSSDSKVATVAADGKVTAVGSGTASITASQDTLSHSASVSVEIPTAIKLDHTDIKITKADEKPKILATVTNEKNLPLVNPMVKFASDNVAIATVDSMGVITGVKRGVTSISATYGVLKTEAKVNVEVGAEEKATAKMDKKAPKKK